MIELRDTPADGVDRPPFPPGFLDKLWGKIGPARLPNGGLDYMPCWEWSGAMSQSGYRGVWYPILRLPRGDAGRGYSAFRVNRLLLLLYSPATIAEVPWDGLETCWEWLLRANRHFRTHGQESSHTCDNSRCPNPEHLEWLSHQDNLTTAADRRRRARESAA